VYALVTLSRWQLVIDDQGSSWADGGLLCPRSYGGLVHCVLLLLGAQHHAVEAKALAHQVHASLGILLILGRPFVYVNFGAIFGTEYHFFLAVPIYGSDDS
jgi:hypothetical protein